MTKLYCITDPESRVAAVLERRPQKWWRVGRWDLQNGQYDRGTWFRGTLYPQRCDLSPGGRWFSYFALKSSRPTQGEASTWPEGEAYNAISRLPWLKALATWKEHGTWSRGFHFVSESDVWEVGEPAVGDVAPCRAVCGMRPTAPAQFAMERRRGWTESASTPSRAQDDMWDERRDVVMEKNAPNRDFVLSVRGKFEAFRQAANDWPPHPCPYSLSRPRGTEELLGVQWADWTSEGNLAVALAGTLQIRDVERGRVVCEVRLEESQPNPLPAPEWADEW